MLRNKLVGASDYLPELKSGLSTMQISAAEPMILQLAQHCDLVARWNQRFNFVSRQDIARLVARHVLDSLSARPWVAGKHLLDVGSGAGFPGIPMAIVCDDRQVVVCERMARRARFLHQVVNELALANVTVVDTDIDRFEPPAKIDTVLARAVATPSSVWAMVQPVLADNGRVLIYASTQSAQRTDALPAQVAWTLHQVQVPGLKGSHDILELRHG